MICACIVIYWSFQVHVQRPVFTLVLELYPAMFKQTMPKSLNLIFTIICKQINLRTEEEQSIYLEVDVISTRNFTALRAHPPIFLIRI